MSRRVYEKLSVGVVVVLAVSFCCCRAMAAQAPPRAPVAVRVEPRLLRVPGFLLARAPDLQVQVSGPDRAIPGEDIGLKVTV